MHATPVFHGLSQEMPPAADQQEKPVGFVFSPGTLQKEAVEHLSSLVEDPAQKTKKHRKRGKKAESQPPPKRIRAKDDVVPAHEDGLPRIHIAGEAILTPELLRLARGAMQTLNDGIKTLEGILIKDKDPN